MATIVERRKKDGSFSYLARIRIARRGREDDTESRTFPRKAMAEEWAKRRELELSAPGDFRWRGAVARHCREERASVTAKSFSMRCADIDESGPRL